MGIGHLSLLYKSAKNNLGLSLVGIRVFPVNSFSPHAKPILGTNGGMNTIGVGGLHHRYFQMAEVKVSRSLFHDIFEHIYHLKPVPIGSGECQE